MRKCGENVVQNVNEEMYCKTCLLAVWLDADLFNVIALYKKPLDHGTADFFFKAISNKIKYVLFCLRKVAVVSKDYEVDSRFWRIHESTFAKMCL